MRCLGRLFDDPGPAKLLETVCFERVDSGYRLAGKVQGVKVTGGLNVQDRAIRASE